MASLVYIVELAVPVWAESARPIPFHRHHIIERHDLPLRQKTALPAMTVLFLLAGSLGSPARGFAALSVVMVLWQAPRARGIPEGAQQDPGLPLAGYGQA